MWEVSMKCSHVLGPRVPWTVVGEHGRLGVIVVRPVDLELNPEPEAVIAPLRLVEDSRVLEIRPKRGPAI